MKKTLLTLFIALLSTSVKAAPLRNVVIYQQDGQMLTFAFEQDPKVNYSGNNLVLTTATTTVQFPIYLLRKLVFEEDFINGDGSEVDAVETVKSHMNFAFQNGTLTVSAGEAGSLVLIYDTKGVMVGEYRLDSNGNAIIPLQGMRSDVYIVKTNRLSFKFRKS